MSEAPEESFISHLVELRDRLMRSLIAIAVVLGVLCIYPGPGEIYDILAAPLTRRCRKAPRWWPSASSRLHGAAEGNGDGRLCAQPALHPLPGLGLHCPGLYAHEKRLGIPLIISSTLLFISACHSAISSCSARYSALFQLCTEEHHAGTGYRGLLVFRDDHVPGLRHRLRGAGCPGRSGQAGYGDR
jgi:hypothetical protein